MALKDNSCYSVNSGIIRTSFGDYRLKRTKEEIVYEPPQRQMDDQKNSWLRKHGRLNLADEKLVQ